MKQTLTVPAEYGGSRIDVVISACGDLSRSAAQRLIVENRVTVHGRTARKNDRVAEGTVLELERPEPVSGDAEPEAIELDIVFEDGDLLVVNKPRGLVVHPSPGHESGTLVNALLHHCGDSLSGIGGVKRPGIVHRIDKDTSGLLVAAKTDRAHVALSAALKRHDIRRVYLAIARGVPKSEAITIDAPLGRHPVHRKKQAVLPYGGRAAVTHVAVLECFSGYSLLRCELETGRTHQIRVHLAHAGYPLAGDALYNPHPAAAGLLDGQALHAAELHFTHPVTGSPMSFTAPPPACFTVLLEKLRGKAER